MKPDTKRFLLSVAIPLLVGGIAGFLTRTGTMAYAAMTKPSLSPPAIVFPIVWTVLYTLMGISYYLINETPESALLAKANSLYFYQLIVNFLWSFFFFGFEWYFFSFLWILFLWVLVAYMIKSFASVSKVAAYINIPYLVWLTFAAYLNLGVWQLNR